MDDITDTQIVSALLQQQLTLSLKAIAIAKEAAWRDLPMNEQRMYLKYAERAVIEDAKERKPS